MNREPVLMVGKVFPSEGDLVCYVLAHNIDLTKKSQADLRIRQLAEGQCAFGYILESQDSAVVNSAKKAYFKVFNEEADIFMFA